MTISIITISYNAEKCIAHTIESILNQERSINEYILIDGGSQDNTNIVIESFRTQFENKEIKFVHISEPDNGISDAFNKGINLATSEFVGLINADDELLPDAIKIIQSIKDYESFDVIYGNALWIDELHGIQYIRKSGTNLNELLYDMIIMHPSTFVKKYAYEKFGTFDVNYKYCMDEELLLRMFKKNAKFKYIDKSLTKFKAGGVSDAQFIKSIKEGIHLGEQYNAPKLKIKLKAAKKILRYKISSVLKNNGLFAEFHKGVSSVR